MHQHALSNITTYLISLNIFSYLRTILALQSLLGLVQRRPKVVVKQQTRVLL